MRAEGTGGDGCGADVLEMEGGELYGVVDVRRETECAVLVDTFTSKSNKKKVKMLVQLTPQGCIGQLTWFQTLLLSY